MQSFQTADLPENPRDRANILSNFCLCDTFSIFFKGRKKTLNHEDLYQALKEHKSETLGNALCNSWQQEVQNKTKSKKEPSLLLATLRVFAWQLASLGFLLFLLEMVLNSFQPIFLNGLISYYSNGDESLNNAYFYAGALILISALVVLTAQPYKLGTAHLGMKIRIAMCSMIYRKALRLGKTGSDQSKAGEVMNLISNDVGRLDIVITNVHTLWVAPLQTILVTYLMYLEIGVAALFGVAFLILFIPLQIWLSKKTSVLRLLTALRTDERVRMMSEIIAGIQVIKVYAWEMAFGKMVANARKREMRSIRLASYIRGMLLSFIIFLTRGAVFLSLVGYVLMQQILTPQKAFVTTAFFNVLRITLTFCFPQGLSQLAEALVSFKRIEKYMMYDETLVRDKSIDSLGVDNYAYSIQSIIYEEVSEDEDLSKTHSKTIKNSTETFTDLSIMINNLKVKWHSKATEYTLNNINLSVQPGSLVAVIGPVGSGKSSLIQSILGELPAESGAVKVNGTFSYASQEPWLFTGTVRQNILFGAEMNRQRYCAVVKKCALERDLELLPHGDKTIMGERGASLSGGQKARISLARAVYRQTSIYLLDDPLSAVDTHVGRHLFDQCILDLLREKTVLLVTHQLQFVQSADQIVIMDKGQVSAVGSYDSLRESGLDFAQLLEDHNYDQNHKEEIIKEEIVKEQIVKEEISADNNKCIRKRKTSSVSVNSEKESTHKEMPSEYKEFQEKGKIGLSIYKKYFKAGGGFVIFSIMILLCVSMQAIASGGDYFLSYWVSNNRITISERSVNATKEVDTSSTKAAGTRYVFLRKLGIDEISDEILDIYIFTIINIATIIMTLGRSFFFFNVAMRASINLHNAMFRGISRASMFFFHTNPLGRILNRFSKDIGQVDEALPPVMMDVLQTFLTLSGIVVVITIVNAYLLLPTLIYGLSLYYIRSFYLKTSRDVKRLEGIARSPIYSHMAATLTGLSTIRSFGAQQVLVQEFDNFQDLHSSSFFMFVLTARAFGYWQDCLCLLYIAIVTLSFFIFTPSNGGEVGLAITQAIGMTGLVNWAIRRSAELENTMTAVERVVEYESIESEGALECKSDKKPPQEWPEEGEIVFENLSLRYNPDAKTDNVLDKLSFVIQPCEKVGIVGRTGAGKSSLINAIFRLSYNEGAIIIDGRDIRGLGLHDLRSKISIIPQEPVLFSGTVRYNLDPFDEYSDAKLWESLEEVKLNKFVAQMPSGLQTKISESGCNFSVGQRQLVCLARAILCVNRILVMDEATANVDPQTDALIQATIRNKFKNCTVLTIAHRLNTVMDSDKVLVMDGGRVAEFGSPYELLLKEHVFYGMARQTGKATFEALLKTAKTAHEQKLKTKSE